MVPKKSGMFRFVDGTRDAGGGSQIRLLSVKSVGKVRGDPRGTRTLNQLIKSQLLYRLS
jgi:hypothetical protein